MEGEKEAEDVLLDEEDEEQGQRQANKKKEASTTPIDAEEADEMERLDLTYVLFDNLPSEESERLIKIAKEGKDEQILFIEQPSFWISNRSLICVSLAGSAAFLLSILLILTVGLDWEFVILGIFVIIFGITMMGYHKKRFVILTSEKIIIYKQRSPAIVVPYDSLITVTNRLNWLLWMRELELRKRESGKFSPTTISKQSGIKQEFIDGFSSFKLKEIEDFILKQLPAYQGEDV
jgi:hypothetical protein